MKIVEVVIKEKRTYHLDGDPTDEEAKQIITARIEQDMPLGLKKSEPAGMDFTVKDPTDEETD
jgi:hypothetical protein